MIELLLILLAVAILGGRLGYRRGYAAGHTDALLERKGHQPMSKFGRRTHRHLSVYR